MHRQHPQSTTMTHFPPQSNTSHSRNPSLRGIAIERHAISSTHHNNRSYKYCLWGWCRFVGLVVDSITTNHATRPSSRRRSMIPVPRCRCRYLCDTRRSVRRSSRFPVWRARLPFRYSLPLRELSRIARLRVVLSAAPPVGRSPPAPASGSLLTVVGFVRFVRWCGSRWRPHRPAAH